MLKLESFAVGPLGCNCSLLWDPEAGTGVVVDPGGEGARIQRRVAQLGFKVQALLHTHAHFDHVGATRELQDLWQCPAYLHEADGYLIEHLDMQTGLFGMASVPRPETEHQAHGERREGLAVLHTPGHTPGSCCFHGAFDQGQVVLSGDTLFAGGIGRTDLWGGDTDLIMRSLRGKLMTLDEQTRVIAGHGPATTIGEEKRGNPFLRR